MSTAKTNPPPRPAGKRDRILDEALILAGSCGYRGFSFKDLAERCALTKQGVLHYFPSKEDLLLRLLDERDASIEAELLALLDGSGFEPGAGDAKQLEVLREGLAKVIAHMTRFPELIKLHVVLRGEAISVDHPASAYFKARDQATLAWLSERLAPFVPEPHSKARQLLAALLGLQAQWLQEEQGFDLAGEWERALEALLPAAHLGGHSGC